MDLIFLSLGLVPGVVESCGEFQCSGPRGSLGGPGVSTEGWSLVQTLIPMMTFTPRVQTAGDGGKP